MTLDSMSRERWSVLEPLLDAALELAPPLRAEFLDDACLGDTTLRAEVGQLLAACELADTILGDPAAVTYGPLLAETTPVLPMVLGDRYHIVREIGRGGMATVYLADDTKHGRRVAVKALHAEVAQIIGHEQFAREIEIAAGLSHPHILPLHDSGEVTSEDDSAISFLYFITPFAAGESLRDRLRREPKLTIEESVQLGREIALALDYAHRRGVVHLDVKPGNVLLHEGHAVIADFGIARAISIAGDRELPRQPSFLGTPSYMSPEQAFGLSDVDGRSDIYSLGCVLYEMLTGAQPFTRASRMQVVEAARAGTGPDAAALHQHVPRELAEIVLRAMAPSRDERFRTAGELAQALSAAVRGAGGRRLGRAGLTVASIAALAVSTLGLWRHQSARALDDDLIAVAPFDAEAPSLALWKEGLVDVISRSLDGAGALRAVPASIVVRRWQGRADVESAQALGRATGARLVLFGGLLAAGDSVRATLKLLDVATRHTIAEFEQRDLTDRIDRVSDSLTLAVLRQLRETRHIDMANATSSPTSSLVALKAYLQGEQFYRAARWDSAQMRFERALALDTTFALAYHRLASVRRWRDTKEIPDSAAYQLMRRASYYPRGLGPRERMLATIDSLSAETYFAWRRALENGHYADEEALFQKLCDALVAALRQYPNDPELTFLHAEARAEYDRDVVWGEVDDRATLARYDRAIGLDSGFAPAYVRPIALAAYLYGADSARRYIRSYLALAPSGPRSELIRLADVLLDSARAPSVDAAQLVENLSPDALCEVATLLQHIPDSAETIVRIGQALASREPIETSKTRASCAVRQTVNALQFRGRLRDADRLASMGAHGLRPVVRYNMARFGVVPADSSRAEFRRILALAPRTRITKLYGWWATDGDTSAIRAYVEAYTSAATRAKSPAMHAMYRSSATIGRAYLSLAKRDTSSALRQFMATTDTLYECWHENRMPLVQLLSATGRYREAAERLERRWPGTTMCSNGVDDVLWTLERGRVFERVGRRAEAAASYELVVKAWRTADPELQPYVREARTALARLRDGLFPRVAAL
jgi:TolB-like protein